MVANKDFKVQINLQNIILELELIWALDWDEDFSIYFKSKINEQLLNLRQDNRTINEYLNQNDKKIKF